MNYLFLHNPELSFYTQTSQVTKEQQREIFFQAFKLLEVACSSGQIANYGVSSNNFNLSLDSEDRIDVKELHAIASAASKSCKPHFRAIQTPLNLFEQGALLNGTIKDAKDIGLEVMTNRSLTSSFDGKNHLFRDPNDRNIELKYRSIRDDLLAHLFPEDRNLSEQDSAGSRFLMSLINDLERDMLKFQGVQHFLSDLEHSILPLLNKNIEELDDRTFSLIRSFFICYENMIRQISAQGTRKLAVEQGHTLTPETLLQDFALDFVLSKKDIDVVFVGLAKMAHVISLNNRLFNKYI